MDLVNMMKFNKVVNELKFFHRHAYTPDLLRESMHFYEHNLIWFSIQGILYFKVRNGKLIYKEKVI